MQFLYADGADAHFMDTGVLRADRGRRRHGRRSRCAGSSRAARSTCCSSTTSRPTSSCRARSTSRSPRPSPGLRGDTRLGRRHQARDARDRRDDPGAAVRRTSASASAWTPAPANTSRGRSARAVGRTVRRSEQRRAAVVALLPARPDRPAAGADAGGDASLFTRALAHAAAERAEELDELIDRHAHGWTVQRIQPLERSIMRVALVEMLHPGRGARRTSRSRPRGRSTRRWRARRSFCGADAPGFVNGVLAAVLREVRENTPEAHPAAHDASA